MTDPEWEAGNLLDVLGDPLCRQVLVYASKSPISATALADQLDVSPPTVYRRINSLVDHELVRTHRRLDGDGNHYRTFETALDRIEVELTQDGYEVSIHSRQDAGHRFDEFWREFASAELPTHSDRSAEIDSGSDSSPS